MGHPDSINVIALSLRSTSVRVLSMVLEILGAVCLIPSGHKRILQGTGSDTHHAVRRRWIAPLRPV